MIDSLHWLFIRLVDHLPPTAASPYKATTDFSIDASHELALFIWSVDKNLQLKPVPYFCSHYGADCAIYARDENIYCVRQKAKSLSHNRK